jgi:hypothetical protein
MSSWKWATTWGILRNGKPDVTGSSFHAGHVSDAIRLDLPPSGPLLVASDTSGVWILNEGGGPAVALSWNWDKSWGQPAITCLSHGFFPPWHVYAAGASLWETDVTQPAPLLAWRRIPIADRDKKPFKVGIIHRVVVVSQRGVIVLAGDFGVFWAKIPSPGGVYVFQKATGLPGNRYSGLAEGPNTTVVAGAWGTDKKSHFGVFHGDWTGGGLSFKPSAIPGGIDRQMLRVDIAAFPGMRFFMYAICADSSLMNPVVVKGVTQTDGFGDIQWQNPGTTDPGDQDPILTVLQSSNGGVSWTPTLNTIIGKPDPLFPFTPGTKNWAGVGQGGYNVCVGVSPFDKQIVAVGMNNFFVSVNSGDTWQLFQPDDGIPDLHGDIHGLFFDQTDASRLYVCSDGGVAMTPDLGSTWQSWGNRQFPNLQCFRFGASPHDSGVMAVSLQDNGNAYTSLYIDPIPWDGYDGGDGRVSMILDPGALVRTNNDADADGPGGTKIPVGQATRAAAWDGGSRTFHDIQMFPDPPLSAAVIPVDGTGRGLVTNVMEPVAAPVFANGAGELLVGVGANGEQVLGLFARGDGTFHWQVLNTVPHKPDINPDGTEKPYNVTAVGSLGGNAVFAGTNNGKVFRLDAPDWSITDLLAPLASASVTRFAVPSADLVYLIAGATVFADDAAGWRTLPGKVIGPGGLGVLPNTGNFTGIEVDRTINPATVYVASGAGVWKSDDTGVTWSDFNSGLPNAPQCQDLRIATEASGVTFLYVSTWGWSVLRLPIGFNEILKPITVTGHMDLVDKVAFGKNPTANPPFGGARMLGPLHPMEAMPFSGEVPEFRTDLNLKLQWKTDFSVDLTVVAQMTDKSDGNTDATASGSHNIPLNTTENVVVELDSGEVAPDHATIDFDVTNG